VASGSLLGEHECTVDGHLEEPARRFEQPNVGIGIHLRELGRQTGGSWLVVSDNTVLDSHMHDRHRAAGLEHNRANRSGDGRRCQGDYTYVTANLVSPHLVPYLFDPC
jgi:hypothetical protein